MFTQSEEQWKETDDLSSSEYQRRITHEDICNCYDTRRFMSRSSSQNWRKSTDHCGGFSDYAILYPSHLWFRNDLRGRSRQRCRHNLNGCCNCCSRYSRNQQRYRECRSEETHNRRKHWDALNSEGYNDQFMKSSENLRTVRIIPMTFVSTLTTKDSSDFRTGALTDSRNVATDTGDSLKATDAPYYGPFRARKIKVTPAIMAVKTRRCRSVHESYSLERKYLREIQNDIPKTTEHSTFMNETTHDRPIDSKIVSDTYHDMIPKHICSEFDEIPLFVSKIPKTHTQTYSSNLQGSPTTMIDQCEKVPGKNSISEENHHETGRDTLMEGLALLKHRKKEQEKKAMSQTLPHEDNQIEANSIITKKSPEIREYLHEKMQQFAIKKITTYWHKKTFKKYNQIEKYSQKLVPSQVDHHNLYNGHIQQDDIIQSQTIPINVENTSFDDIDNDVNNSNKSKFTIEMHQEREKLRKILKDSKSIISNRNASKSEITTTDTGFFFSLFILFI